MFIKNDRDTSVSIKKNKDVHIYRKIWSDVNRRFCPMLIQKHLKTPYIFSESTACFKFRQSLKRASSLLPYLNFKHWHDVPIGKYIQR